MDQPTFDFELDEEARRDDSEPDDGAGPDTVVTHSVGELNGVVRDLLRQAFPLELWVRGEVQNLKRSSAGHTYFTLVEKSGRGDRIVARLDVVLFRDDRPSVDRALAAVPGAELGDDVEVRICGRVTMYPASGRYQLVMSGIDPVFTVGGIAANRERALRALAADGLLEANGRHDLALVPLRVGLVTSEGSAAARDFLHELEASAFAWQVAVVDVRVQGSAAARRIKWALGELARVDLDVVVLVRGGGARADLAPFDTELVARAVAAMPVPVITGVGHETDRSVADVVAHTACKTPTACAQTLVERVRRFAGRLDETEERVGSGARRRASLASRELDEAARRVLRSAPASVTRERGRIERRQARVEELARRRAADSARLLDAQALRIVELGRRATRDRRRALATRERAMVAAASHHLRQSELRIDAAAGALRALDPRRVLERGYSITRDAAGRVVKEAEGLVPGAVIETELAAGRVTSRVDHISEEPER
jgi:exodeoxyribonuclease VII large subunit